MSRHCSSVKSVGYDLSFIAPLPQNLTPTRRVNNSPDQMSRDNNCLKFSKPCNGHALKGLVKNWWASDTSLKDNAMEASDATNSFVRNHAGVSDQVRTHRLYVAVQQKVGSGSLRLYDPEPAATLPQDQDTFSWPRPTVLTLPRRHPFRRSIRSPSFSPCRASPSCPALMSQRFWTSSAATSRR